MWRLRDDSLSIYYRALGGDGMPNNNNKQQYSAEMLVLFTVAVAIIILSLWISFAW